MLWSRLESFQLSQIRYLNYVYGGYFECKECGGIFKQNKKNNLVYCRDCIQYNPIETKTIICQDCGKEVVVDARNMTKTRCDECQKVRDTELKAERNKRYYQKHK